ncbi:hypothetical protein ACS0TY_010612 [Phlomoides rotata]
MESGGNNNVGLEKGKKTDRNRRAWTPVEELILIDLMKDLVTKGWRTENGFKPGYLQKLEAGMMRKLPGTNIRVVPHITPRLTIWKKFHGSLQMTLTGNSGIGFNSATGMLDCHNDAWALIVKADPNAINMRYKSWPLYEDCKEIFGMEHANGGVDEDVPHVVHNLHTDDTSQGSVQNETPVEVDPKDPEPVVDMDVMSEAPAINRVNASKSSDVRMESLVCVIGYGFDLGRVRKEVFNMLDGMTDISKDDKVDAAHWFGKNVDCLEVFIGMTESSRVRYVHRLLTGQLKF